MATSYNTTTTAEAIIGCSVSEALLQEARSIIDKYSIYRWEATTTTSKFSTRDLKFNKDGVATIFIKMPVTSITTFTIGVTSTTTLTENTHYQLREDIGQITILSTSLLSSDSLTGIDDISITYIYGWDEDHELYPIVLGTEARIALLLKTNPLLLASINLMGDVTNYGDDKIESLLKEVPKPTHIRMF